jgi:hypothetical protein
LRIEESRDHSDLEYNESKEGNSDIEAFPWHFHGKSIDIDIEWTQVEIIITITTVQ